jgi:hypothetical protein
MDRKRLSAQMIGLALALLLVASCAAPTAVPTLTPVPPTPTPLPPTLVSRATPSAAPTSTSVPPTRTPLPPPIAPDFPTGTFFHKHADATFCVFEFNEDGTWALFWKVPSVDVGSRRPYLRGTYSIDGNLYTETSITSADCPWPATYAWAFDGRTLAFQVVGEDRCGDRQQTYESPLLWTKLE